MPNNQKIVIASANPSKQAELRRLLRGLPLETLAPDEAGVEDLRPREDGWTFQDNAEYKARAYARRSGLPAIASDGGLEIPILRGRWEGLKTRRFAGPDDADRIRALLDLMGTIPPEGRAARFHEAVAVAEPDGAIVISAQRAGPIGRIAETPDSRRRKGFWVPSLWLYPPRWVTEWDLTDEERARRHTAWDAVAAVLRPKLEAWCGVAAPGAA
jgi:XTP/dITP diphosphohydrolase